MCHLIAAFLLTFPLINLTFGRPTMTQVSRRVVDVAGGQLRAVVISRRSGHLTARSQAGRGVSRCPVRDGRALSTTNDVYSQLGRRQGGTRLRTCLPSENSRHGPADADTATRSLAVFSSARDLSQEARRRLSLSQPLHADDLFR